MQSCIRRFLARVKFIRMKREMTFSVLTLQKYIRGWIVRKKTQTLKKNKNPTNVNGVDDCKRNEVDGRIKNHLKEINPLPQVQNHQKNGIVEKPCKEKDLIKIGSYYKYNRLTGLYG